MPEEQLSSTPPQRGDEWSFVRKGRGPPLGFESQTVSVASAGTTGSVSSGERFCPVSLPASPASDTSSFHDLLPQEEDNSEGSIGSPPASDHEGEREPSNLPSCVHDSETRDNHTLCESQQIFPRLEFPGNTTNQDGVTLSSKAHSAAASPQPDSPAPRPESAAGSNPPSGPLEARSADPEGPELTLHGTQVPVVQPSEQKSLATQRPSTDLGPQTFSQRPDSAGKDAPDTVGDEPPATVQAFMRDPAREEQDSDMTRGSPEPSSKATSRAPGLGPEPSREQNTEPGETLMAPRPLRLNLRSVNPKATNDPSSSPDLTACSSWALGKELFDRLWTSAKTKFGTVKTKVCETLHPYLEKFASLWHEWNDPDQSWKPPSGRGATEPTELTEKKPHDPSGGATERSENSAPPGSDSRVGSGGSDPQKPLDGISANPGTIPAGTTLKISVASEPRQ